MKHARFFPVLMFLSLLLTGCLGPDPHVLEKSFAVSTDDPGSYSAKIVVENRNDGEGEVKIKAQLRDRSSGLIYKGRQNVDIGPHEKVGVEILIKAPKSDYDLEAQAEYPPG